MHFELVTVSATQRQVIMTKTDNLAVIVHPYDERATLCVGKSRNCLDDDFLHLLPGHTLLEVPTHGGLEFKLVAFPFFNQVFDCRRRCRFLRQRDLVQEFIDVRGEQLSSGFQELLVVLEPP